MTYLILNGNSSIPFNQKSSKLKHLNLIQYRQTPSNKAFKKIGPVLISLLALGESLLYFVDCLCQSLQKLATKIIRIV